MNQTLPQRLYLLSYNVDKGRFDLGSSPFRGQLLRAAALTELTVDGLLSDQKGKAAWNTAEPSYGIRLKTSRLVLFESREIENRESRCWSFDSRFSKRA